MLTPSFLAKNRNKFQEIVLTNVVRLQIKKRIVFISILGSLYEKLSSIKNAISYLSYTSIAFGITESWMVAISATSKASIPVILNTLPPAVPS